VKTYSNATLQRLNYQALEAQMAAADAAQVEESSKPGEVPSKVDVNQRGYLQGSVFTRRSLDFDKNNLSCSWARGILQDLTKHQTGLVVKFNEQLLRQYGESTWLYTDAEEAADFLSLVRLFTLSEEEAQHMQCMKKGLKKFITDSPPFNYVPPEEGDGDDLVDIQAIPNLGGLTPWHKRCIVFEPIIDFDHKLMAGKMGKAAKDLVSMLDDLVYTVLGKSTGGLPPPVLEPEKGDAIVPCPPLITEEDIPQYALMEPPDPVLCLTPRIGSPFPDKELTKYTFVEENMPVFSVEYGEPKWFEPLCAPMDFMHPTWGPDGASTISDLYVPPLLDQHVWPPLEITESTEKFSKRKVLRRGIWEIELYTSEGVMVPDLFEITRVLPCPLVLDDYSFEDIQNELRGSTEIVEEMLPIRPVKSLVKFFWDARPLPVADVLMDLVRVDFSGANFLAIIEQRYSALKVIREEERVAAKRAQILLEEKERLEREARDEYALDKVVKEEDYPKVDREEGDEAALPPPALQEDVEPGEKVDPTGAEAPPDAAVPATEEAGEPSAGPAEGDQATDVLEHTAGAGVFDSPTAGAGPFAGAFEAPAEPAQRGDIVSGLQDLLAKEKQALNMENLLMDNFFVERLAEKIVGKLGYTPPALGGGGGGSAGGAGGQASAPPPGKGHEDQVQGYPVPGGDLTQTKNVSGKAFVSSKKAQPSFGAVTPASRDPANDLPIALQGVAMQQQMQAGGVGYNAYRAAQLQAKPLVFSQDVDEATEEKKRGESYIRLLTKISNRVGDGKVIKPYRGDLVEPPAKLLVKTRYNLEMPVPIGEEDEFEEMDRGYTVLFSFVRHNRYEAVESLLQQDPELLIQKDENGNGLLHIAAQNNHRRVAKLLLKMRADVDAKNTTGNTPLHYCYSYGYSQLAEFLVTVGADEQVQNNAGLVPSEGLGEEKAATGKDKMNLQTRMG
jgi:hypothetical protein